MKSLAALVEPPAWRMISRVTLVAVDNDTDDVMSHVSDDMSHVSHDMSHVSDDMSDSCGC